MERLPILATLQEALRRYRQHFPQLLRVIALPALAQAAIASIWLDTTQQDKWLVLLLLLAQALLLTLAAISCHRIILLGPESVPPLGASGNAARDWKFIGTAAFLYLVMLVALQVSSTVVFIPLSLVHPDVVHASRSTTQTLLYLAMLPGLYVTSRLALCLPAVAIDRRLDPKKAWDMSRGDGLRLLVLIGLLPWLLQFIRRQLAWVIPAAGDAVVVHNLLLWVLLPFEVAVLSLCYRRLSKP